MMGTGSRPDLRGDPGQQLILGGEVPPHVRHLVQGRASWKVASARLSAAAACTFCPTMMIEGKAKVS